MTTAIGETGVTMSCSSVPRSRSFTIANAERIVPENVSRMEMRPGISRFALRMSGLNIITGCASTGGCGTALFHEVLDSIEEHDSVRGRERLRWRRSSRSRRS